MPCLWPQKVLPDMVEFIAKLRERITVGVVGGSDLPKQMEQLGESGTPLVNSPCIRFGAYSAPLFLSCVLKNRFSVLP